MTVASPAEIGCRYCRVGAGERCVSWKVRGDGSTQVNVRRDPHAIRKADAQLDEALPGWQPTDPTAEIIDFAAARRRRAAARNGVDLG